MKIAFVYSGYIQHTTSGIRVQVDSMMDFLKKRGHKVYLYPLKEVKWLPVILLILSRIIKPTLGGRFKKWLKEIEPDMIIVQGIYLPEARQLAYFKKQHWNTILIQHGFPDSFWARPVVWLYLLIVGKRSFRKMDRIITVSDHTYNKILPFVEKSKITIIPLGIDFEKFYPLAKEENNKIRENFKINGSLILGVGRFTFLKNFRTLIKAIKLIPDANLFLVGGGHQGKKLRILVKWLGLENRVRFFTFLSRQQLMEFYNIADITVLPSLAEGLGLVLIESLACGTPVIGSKLEGITEIIEEGKNGLFLENFYDEKELAGHINKLLKNKKICRQMGQYGIESVKNKFDKDKLLLEFERTIKNIF